MSKHTNPTDHQEASLRNLQKRKLFNTNLLWCCALTLGSLLFGAAIDQFGDAEEVTSGDIGLMHALGAEIVGICTLIGFQGRLKRNAEFAACKELGLPISVKTREIPDIVQCRDHSFTSWGLE